MDDDTTRIDTLEIDEMIVDEFLRLGVRPDWHPGAAALRPRDFDRKQPPRTFRGDNMWAWQLDTAPIRLGVKK